MGRKVSRLISVRITLCLMTLVVTSSSDDNSLDSTAMLNYETDLPTANSIYDTKTFQNVIVDSIRCQCDINIAASNRRHDYKYSPGIGAHKLHTKQTTFNEARKICNQEGGHLAIIDSVAEEQILLGLFEQAKSIKDFESKQAYLGIHDNFAEGEWVTILNDPLHSRGYSKWSIDNGFGGQPDNFGGNQNCAGLLRPEVGTGMDDIGCDSMMAFFCEIPEVRFPNRL